MPGAPSRVLPPSSDALCSVRSEMSTYVFGDGWIGHVIIHACDDHLARISDGFRHITTTFERVGE